MLFIVLISLLGGLIGGFANRLLEVRDGIVTTDPAKFDRIDRFAVAMYPYVIGVAAACCVPLFLSLTQSKLLTSAMAMTPGGAIERFVLFGFAIVAALSSRRFLDTLSNKLIDATNTARTAAAAAAQNAAAAADAAKAAGTRADSAKDAAEQAAVLARAALEPSTGDAAPPNPTALSGTWTALNDGEKALLLHLARPGAGAPSESSVLKTGLASETSSALKNLETKRLLKYIAPSFLTSEARWVITAHGCAVAASAR